MTTPNKHSRRELLRLSAGSLLAAGLWPGRLRAEGDGNSADFHFIEVNDTHYVDADCGKFLEGVVKQMKAAHVKVDFCLHCGDLCDHGKREELAPVKELFGALNMPTYAVIGNHDYLAPEDRKAYEELFPDRLNYRFENRGWQFVGLDTSEGQKYNKTTIQPPTLAWLDEQVPKLDKKRPTVVFTHFPLGSAVKHRPVNADDVLARFKDYNLQAVFCGHYHAYTESKFGNAAVTTNRCCALKRNNHDGTKEKGYFLCHAKDGKVSREFIEVKA